MCFLFNCIPATAVQGVADWLSENSRDHEQCYTASSSEWLEPGSGAEEAEFPENQPTDLQQDSLLFLDHIRAGRNLSIKQ